MRTRTWGLLLMAAMVVAVVSGWGGEKKGTVVAGAPAQGNEVAIFAGGCFWCMEKPFEVIDGVVSVISGYTGGHQENPTYEEVGSGKTGHAEAVRIEYDPSVVTYEELLAVFWQNIDPTTPDRQFCDVGFQYRPEIFYIGEEQLRIAEKSNEEVEASGVVGKVAVRISPASAFYVAEDYHQDFYKTNPEDYERYRKGCGRDRRLAELWGESDH